MTTAFKKPEYFSGQGVLLMADRGVDGSPMGFTPIGNVSELKTSIATTKFEHKDSTSGVRGTDLTLVQEVKATASMTIESIDKDALALAMYGSSASIVGAAVTDEAATAYLGKWIATENIKISAVTITNVLKDTTYEEDKNYVLNLDAGSIQFLSDADQTAAGATVNVADAADILINYTFADQESVSALLTSVAPVKWLRFEGLNTADNNNPVVIDLFKVQTDPLAELGLINSDISKMDITADVLSDDKRATGSKYLNIRKLPVV